MKKKRITKGQPYGRILRVIDRGDREVYYHATRGWKVRRK